MSCDYYYFGEGDCTECFIRFAEDDETFRCLCTFPYNDNEKLTVSRLRSLALLGAALVLANHIDNNIELPVYLPYGIPDWIISGIDKYLPEDKNV